MVVIVEGNEPIMSVEKFVCVFVRKRDRESERENI